MRVALGVCTVPPNATDEGIAQCGDSEPGRLPKLAVALRSCDRMGKTIGASDDGTATGGW
jgi:hypothetical protein